MSKHLSPTIRIPIEWDNPAIVRNEDTCVKCGQCRDVCKGPIAVGRLYDLSQTGDTAICIHCGQCANVCPVNSITERYEYDAVKAALADPEKIVIFSTSPSVRVGLGESFGLEPGSFVEGKMVAALRSLGADYVLDTTFAADLTIMEEASELVERILKGSRPLPQFTSCCPAWVRFVETFYPDFIPNLSTAKSPIGMQGPTIKTWFAQKMDIDPKRIVNVAVTPCSAKKAEIRRPEMNDAGKSLGDEALRDMDHVITTRELARWLKEEGVDFFKLEDAPYDDLLGRGTGAGVIFGNTGGVMEAAVRTAYHLVTGQDLPAEKLVFEELRGMDGIREVTVDLAGIPLKLAVVHGTDNARTLLEKMKAGEADYHFMEVMTCPGGCIGGGGQPKGQYGAVDDSVRMRRVVSLYNQDGMDALRMSHQNPDIKRVYGEYYTAPLSPLAEQFLHTSYTDRHTDLGQ